MDFFSFEGYFAYTLSTIMSFVTGCIPFLILAGAAAFGAPSTLWIVTYSSIAIAWMLCYLIPLLFIASRVKFAPWVSILGSFTVACYCGYAIIVVLRIGNQSPLSISQHAAPMWFWFALPLAFNVLQLNLSVLRLQQIRNSEVTPWPQ